MQLSEAMQHLTDKQRAVAECHGAGLTDSQIAATLGITRQAVNKVWQSAKEKLAEMIDVPWYNPRDWSNHEYSKLSAAEVVVFQTWTAFHDDPEEGESE